MAVPVVIDADAAMLVAELGKFEDLAARHDFLAPRLLWTECCSVLHRAASRRRSFDGLERERFGDIATAPIRLVDDYDPVAPWDIASLLGWQKTYDAEYLAAARHMGAGVFTLDQQLAEGARRLGVPVVVPS